MDFVLSLVGGILLVVCVLVGVAFLTLLERSVLGYVQIRSGPNKVGLVGVPQPFADAIKLFCSEQGYPSMSNFFPYYLCPSMSLLLSLVVWVVVPYEVTLMNFSLGLLFFLCCTSMGVYAVMGAGWSSNSNYALLGALRAVAQTISYEVSLALILLSFVMLVGSYSLLDFELYQEDLWFVFLGFPLVLAWFASCLAETNRTPFDFAEGESELVSGFNVEYSSGGFALIFMAEYASILFMSMMMVVLCMGSGVMSLMFFFKLVVISFLYIWVRGTLPRFRYDKLMYLAWSVFLPMSINYLICFVGFSVILLYFLM